jgi:hypothetical protein
MLRVTVKKMLLVLQHQKKKLRPLRFVSLVALDKTGRNELTDLLYATITLKKSRQQLNLSVRLKNVSHAMKHQHLLQWLKNNRMYPVKNSVLKNVVNAAICVRKYG